MKHFKVTKTVYAFDMVSDLYIGFEEHSAMTKQDFAEQIARWISLSLQLGEDVIAEALKEYEISIHDCNIRLTIDDYELAIMREDIGNDQLFFKVGLYIVEDGFDVEETTEDEN